MLASMGGSMDEKKHKKRPQQRPCNLVGDVLSAQFLCVFFHQKPSSPYGLFFYVQIKLYDH